MPEAVQPAADIQQTPEDKAFLDAEASRLEAKGLEASRAAISNNPLETFDEGEDLAPIGEETASPAGEGDREIASLAPQEGQETQPQEPKPPEKTSELGLLVQEMREARQARERELAEWQARQAQETQRQQPQSLLEMPLEWHKQHAASLGYNFSDKQTGKLQAMMYENQIRLMDSERSRKALEAQVTGFQSNIQNVVTQERVTAALASQLDKYDLPQATQVRAANMVNKLVAAGYSPEDALGETLAFIDTFAKPKAAKPVAQGQQSQIQPQQPSKDRPGLKAGAVSGRGASRSQPTPGQRLEASRAKIFGRN